MMQEKQPQPTNHALRTTSPLRFASGGEGALRREVRQGEHVDSPRWVPWPRKTETGAARFFGERRRLAMIIAKKKNSQIAYDI